MSVALIWFSASCNFTILPNSLGLPALPLRMTSVDGSNRLRCLPSLRAKPRSEPPINPFAVLAKSLWYENVMGTKEFGPACRKATFPSSSSSHPSHAVVSLRTQAQRYRMCCRPCRKVRSQPNCRSSRAPSWSNEGAGCCSRSIRSCKADAINSWRWRLAKMLTWAEMVFTMAAQIAQALRARRKLVGQDPMQA